MSSQAPSSAVTPSVLADNISIGFNNPPLNQPDPDKWYFPKDRLDRTPSRRSGINPDDELSYRQQAANFIQGMGGHLKVSQKCINTAIVYMHRFYMIYSFMDIEWHAISAASMYLATENEKQQRKLEVVIKAARDCLPRNHQPQIDAQLEFAELEMHEKTMLGIFGFDLLIEHPHTYLNECLKLVKANKYIAKTSYFIATNSLHLTTMCLQYKPTVVACVCMYIACKWTEYEIPLSREGKDWFLYVDDSVTTELLEKLTKEFLEIYAKSPTRLKKESKRLENSAPPLSLSNLPYHGFDSCPGQHHQTRSRSPSPKRQTIAKPGNSHLSGKPKPHGMLKPLHPTGMMKPYPPVVPGNSASKYSSHSTHPPQSHASSSKPPHLGMPPGSVMYPHHHQSPPLSKNPYPPHGHGQHGQGQYRHGSPPGMQSSGSSQSHHGHTMHWKPPVSGVSSSHPTSLSSHPNHSSSHPLSSSFSVKNLQPYVPSKLLQMPNSGAPKVSFNKVPGAVKNPQLPPRSLQPLMVKPGARLEFGQTEREDSASGNVHHSQNLARNHDKLEDARDHASVSGMPSSHSSQSSDNDSHQTSHHNMPYLGQGMDRPGGSSSLYNQKIPYMDSRSMAGSDINRHRGMPLSNDPYKRSMSHGTSMATNGNNNGNMSSGGGNSSRASDSHEPSKSTYSMLIENNASNNKRPRSEEDVSSVTLSTKSLFTPEELKQSSTSSASTFSSKRAPPETSLFSPSALEGTQPLKKSPIGTGNTSGETYSYEGIWFGSSPDTNSDIRVGKLNPSQEFQAPSLLRSIGGSNSDSLLSSSNVLPPRAPSIFSPEYTPSSTIPSDLNTISPPLATTATEVHSKRDSLFSNLTQESTDTPVPSQDVTNSYSEDGDSQSILTDRFSGSPSDHSHRGKKSKKSKKGKHKHKHEKKHKKDKHKDKKKEKKHRSKHRHNSGSSHNSSPPPVEVPKNAIFCHNINININIPRADDDNKSGAVQPTTSSASCYFSSLYDDTPCCLGFEPCLTCKRDTADDTRQYGHFTTTLAQGLKMKFARSKESSKSSFEESSSSSSSKDSKKSKDKTS